LITLNKTGIKGGLIIPEPTALAVGLNASEVTPGNA
jgi:hypothetical protein